MRKVEIQVATLHRQAGHVVKVAIGGTAAAAICRQRVILRQVVAIGKLVFNLRDGRATSLFATVLLDGYQQRNCYTA